jgi:hypothetical protein
MRRAATLLLALAACKTVPEASSGQGGAVFRAAPTEAAASARAMMDVCWPAEAIARPEGQLVRLTFVQSGGHLDDVMFEAPGKAGNSVGRCLRQVAWAYPWKPGEAPAALELVPPARRPSGWVQLAYVRQLSAMSFGDDRGVLDPAPLVRACLARGLGARPQLVFKVEPAPVRVATFSDGPTRVVSDTERCVLAVLAATQYPGSRGFELSFASLEGAPPPASADQVRAYFAPGDVPAGSPLDPAVAREALQLRGPQVAACWEAALARRAGLAGGRSLRLRVGPGGEVVFATVVANQSNSSQEAADLLFDRCLVAAAEGARFPAAGVNADVIYSWVFAHR